MRAVSRNATAVAFLDTDSKGVGQPGGVTGKQTQFASGASTTRVFSE